MVAADRAADQITCRVRPDQCSRRRATISPREALVIRQDRMARVPEVTALEDIRLRKMASRTANRKDTAGHRTVRHTADEATAALPTKAAVAIARPVTVHQATAEDAHTVAVLAADTAPRLRPVEDRPPTVAAEVHEVALVAAAVLAHPAGQAALEDIANTQSEMKLLLSVPPLTGRLFLSGGIAHVAKA